MTREVVVLGDANADMVIHLPDRSVRPLDLTHSVPNVQGGGTAGNTAVALARLGVPVMFAGTVGDDGYARSIAEEFVREGVNTDGLIRLPDAFTPVVIAMVEPDGERMLVVWPPKNGADKQLQQTDVDMNRIKKAAWLHTTGMCLRDSPVRETILHTMQAARAAGVTVSVDLNLRIEVWGWDERLKQTIEQAIASADVVFGSGREEMLPVSGQATMEDAVQALSAGKRIVVARLGVEGALAASPEGVCHIPAFPARVVNTVGAGDAFNGGFIAARLNGHDLAEALRQGNAVAALKIQREGTRELPTRAEVEALLASAP